MDRVRVAKKKEELFYATSALSSEAQKVVRMAMRGMLGPDDIKPEIRAEIKSKLKGVIK